MARKPRSVVPNAAHHIITRGNNRRRLFSYPTDYKRFISGVASALERTESLLHAMTIMPNHVHIIVTPPSKIALSRFVQGFAQRYAQFRNRRRDATGKLFEQRYKSYPILSEDNIAVATVYVDVNAWRAGVVDDPFDYPWSTYAIHAGRPDLSLVPLKLWSPSSWYLGLGKHREERTKQYISCTRRFYLGRIMPVQDGEIKSIEESSRKHYQLRLERPNRSRAR